MTYWRLISPSRRPSGAYQDTLYHISQLMILITAPYYHGLTSATLLINPIRLSMALAHLHKCFSAFIAIVSAIVEYQVIMTPIHSLTLTD